MEQHGGTISVHSKGEGEGSVFTVRLPCIVGSDDANGDDEELFDIEQESKRKLSNTKTSRLMRSSFLSTFNDISVPNIPAGTDHHSPLATPPLLPFQENSKIAVEAESVSELEPVDKLRVLVVDDSDMNRKMVCKVLCATQEFYCEQAVDGSVAVEMVRQQLNLRSIHASAKAAAAAVGDDVSIVRDYSEDDVSFDVILMDYQMPNMDGPTAIAAIRNLGYDSVILGLTGNALLSDRDAMLKAGADGVLVKPMNIDLFRETLQALSMKK